MRKTNPIRSWTRTPRGAAFAAALAVALSVPAFSLAGCRGGGGGGAAAAIAALDATRQPDPLPAPVISALGGDGGELSPQGPGGEGGEVSIDAREVFVGLRGGAPFAGELTSLTVAPGTGGLVVPSGQVVTMTPAQLDGQTFDGISIEGDLVVDLSSLAVDVHSVSISSTGDVLISGTVRVEPPTHALDLTLKGSGTQAKDLLLSGSVDLRDRSGAVTRGGNFSLDTTGADQERFRDVLVSGSIDCSGFSGATGTDAGELTLLALRALTVSGTLRGDGGTSIGDEGGEAAVIQLRVADGTLVLRGDGIQVFGGEGGAANDPSFAPGSGGDGGAILLEAQLELRVEGGVVLLTSGGRANGDATLTTTPAVTGGDAGTIRLSVENATSASSLTMLGVAQAVGGFSPAGNAGDGGEIRVRIESMTAGSADGSSILIGPTGSLLSQGGAADADLAGDAGLIRVTLVSATGTISIAGAVEAPGGSTVGIGAGGRAGYVYVGAGNPPGSGGSYASAAGVVASVSGGVAALGGSTDASTPGAGGLVDFNVEALSISGLVFALDGSSSAAGPGTGQVVTRTTAVVTVGGAIDDEDDDADAAAIAGDLDGADTRPAIRTDLP